MPEGISIATVKCFFSSLGPFQDHITWIGLNKLGWQIDSEPSTQELFPKISSSSSSSKEYLPFLVTGDPSSCVLFGTRFKESDQKTE